MIDAISKYYGKHLKIKFDAQHMVNGSAQSAPIKVIFISLVTSVAQQDGDNDSIIITISKVYITWAGMYINYIHFSGGKHLFHIRIPGNEHDPNNFYNAENVEMQIID